MLMSIKLSREDGADYIASDLGFLLHKNPNHTHEVNLKFGKATVFFPESNDDVCQASIFVDLDTIDLVRNYQGPAGGAKQLKQYVNDRPYTLNSFFSVAISRVYGTALNGTCNKKPELVNQALNYEVEIPALPSRGGKELLERLFSPLDYEIVLQQLEYDEALPDWGYSPYFSVKLKNKVQLSLLLKHLYVLIPVLDNEKHYWVSHDEVEKLIRQGSDWIPQHPEKNLIVSRYLKKQGSLTRKALEQLSVEENELDISNDDDENSDRKAQASEDKLEKKIRLNDLRIQKITETIKSKEISSIIDLGCGEGKYVKEFLKISKLDKVTGIEVSTTTLTKAEQRINIDRLPEKVRGKLSLLQGSLTYNDKRVQGYDLATCIEVIEHIDEDRLDAFKQSLFGFAKPKHVILTTPNAEFNVTFESLPKGKLRHSDHRFEWDRKTFEQWCNDICSDYGYKATFDTIGEVHPEYGAPTQMAIFLNTQ